MLTNNTIDQIILLGLPASGKSELLDYMSKVDAAFKREKFHLGNIEVRDDFVWLWEKFEEDDMWEKLLGKRFHSKKAGSGYDNDPELFDFLIMKLNKEIKSKYLSKPDYYNDNTLFIEFSRGGIKPYKPSLALFDKEVLEKSVIFYVQVEPKESRRRNEARYKEKLKHSILSHKTPDDVMERYYSGDDWTEMTDGKSSGLLEINGVQVPFVTMNNEPESTDFDVLTERYGKAFSKLLKS